MDLANLANPSALLGLAALLASGAALYLAALTLFTLAGLRKPRRRTYAYAVARGIPGEPAELDRPAPFETIPISTGPITTDRLSAQRTVNAWSITGDNPKGPTIIATHGWGASRIDMLSRFEALRPHASRVILWDLPGHGESPGACTLGAREPDALLRVIQTIARGSDDTPAHIVLYGYSLGAEVTLKAIAQLDRTDFDQTDLDRSVIEGVILEAPYRHGITPARAVLAASGFPRLLNLPLAMGLGSLLNRQPPNERWHDLAARYAEPLAGPLALPLLVIHGDADTISPPADGEAIAQAGRGTLTMVPDAGHKDLFTHNAPTRPEIATSLTNYFRNLTESRTPLCH